MANLIFDSQQTMGETDSIVYIAVFVFATIFKIISKLFCAPISRKFYPKYDSLEPALKRHWNTYVLSAIHSVVATICGAYFVFVDEGTKEYPFGPSGKRVRLIFAISCGYFLHDLVEMIRHWHQFGRRSEIAHHLVSLSGTLYITLSGQIPYASCIQLLHELSTPVVCLRWFLLTAGIGKARKRYKVVCFVMMVLFFICRIATIPWFWLSVLPYCFTDDIYCNTAPIKGLAIVFLGMDLLNLHWFRLMFRMFYQVIKDKFKEVKNRIRLHQTFEELSASDLENDDKAD